MLAARVGADHQEVGAGRFALVRDPGRDHHDIAGGKVDHRAARAAEPYPGIAAGYAEHLVRGAVIMVVGVDAVAPPTTPAVSRKQPLARAGPVGTFGKRRAIDDERQRRVVRHDAVIGKAIGLDLRRARRVAHGNAPTHRQPTR